MTESTLPERDQSNPPSAAEEWQVQQWNELLGRPVWYRSARYTAEEMLRKGMVRKIRHRLVHYDRWIEEKK